MRVLIGVDAGGTKTESVAYTPEGEILARALTGFGNLLNGAEQAIDHIVEGIGQCAPKDAAEVFIYIGAAGITAGNNRELLEQGVRDAFPGANVEIYTDTHLMLYALFEGRDGMILISGTGSMALAKRGTEFRRFGGWGQLLGDQGSGYDIVHNAFYQLLDEFDHARPYSPLSARILKELNTDVFGAVKFFHANTKNEIAALLPAVVEEANGGDAVALCLLERAGKQLAYMVAELYMTAGYTAPIELALKGSVLEKIPQVREVFCQSIAAGKGDFTLRESDRSATLGAVYLYREAHG